MSRKHYSQNGEDFILWSLFGQQTNGFYLDVGSLDGMRFSNTLTFDQAGWKGICVEAHPFYAELTKKNRPNSISVHAAVSNEDRAFVEFHTNALGSLSTLDKSLEGYFKSAYKTAFKGFKTMKVPMRALDSILAEHKATSVDVISIDVEGTELDVVRGLTMKKYLPRVLVIESMTPDRQRLLFKYMEACDYIMARKLSNNFFFCRTQEDSRIVASAPMAPKQLIHTDHPLKGKV